MYAAVGVTDLITYTINQPVVETLDGIFGIALVEELYKCVRSSVVSIGSQWYLDVPNLGTNFGFEVFDYVAGAEVSGEAGNKKWDSHGQRIVRKEGNVKRQCKEG